MSEKVKNPSITHERSLTTRNRVARFVLQRSQWVKGFGIQFVIIGEKNLACEFHVRFWAWILQIHSYVRFGGTKRQNEKMPQRCTGRSSNQPHWK